MIGHLCFILTEKVLVGSLIKIPRNFAISAYKDELQLGEDGHQAGENCGMV